MIRPFGKLPIVRIGLVTVHALGKDHRFFEVPIGVALGAVHVDVLSLERKLCPGVVKALIHRAERNLLPARSAVAGLAPLGETSVVRILMAIRALIE